MFPRLRAEKAENPPCPTLPSLKATSLNFPVASVEVWNSAQPSTLPKSGAYGGRQAPSRLSYSAQESQRDNPTGQPPSHTPNSTIAEPVLRCDTPSIKGLTPCAHRAEVQSLLGFRSRTLMATLEGRGGTELQNSRIGHTAAGAAFLGPAGQRVTQRAVSLSWPLLSFHTIPLGI